MSAAKKQMMGFFRAIPETFKYLKEELSDKETQNVLKGFSFKHLPEMLMTGICAIPGVGWLANMLAIPFTMKFIKSGEEGLVDSKAKLRKLSKDKTNPKRLTHQGLKHLISFDEAWNEPDAKRQFFGKNADKKHLLPKYLALKFNKALEGIFHRSEALKNRLQINVQGNSRIYRTFRRWTEARQALRQSKFFGPIFNWMNGSSGGKQVGRQVTKAMPRFIRLFFLVPRVGLQTIYFILGRIPKFP